MRGDQGGYRMAQMIRTSRTRIRAFLARATRFAIPFAIMSLLFSGLVGISPWTTPPEAQAALPASACASDMTRQNGLRISPSHGKVMYIDTGVTPKLDASYVGYVVDDTKTKGLWVSVEEFGGGVISLAHADDRFQELPKTSNDDTLSTVFFLVKAGRSTTVDQTHAVRVYDRRPDLAHARVLAECTFTFDAVKETIQAKSNKVITSVTRTPNTTPKLGDTVTFTVWGSTGNIGSGSVPDNDIVWFTPAALSTWPTQALRLESTSVTFCEVASVANPSCKSGGQAYTPRVFTDQLLIRPALTSLFPPSNGIDYRAEYTFRVIGRTGGDVKVLPVAQISSGTQVKHTDTTGSVFPTFTDFDDASITVTSQKSASAANVPKVTIGGVTYLEVPYEVRVGTTSATALTIDEIVDVPAAGALFAAGSATVDDLSRPVTPIPDPQLVTSEAGLSPRPNHFVGPFTVDFDDTIVLKYTMRLPLAAAGASATYTNNAYALIGEQILGRSSNALSAVNVTVTDDTVGPIDDTTIVLEPSVTTGQPSSVDDSRASLTGTVDANGTSQTATFQFSTSATLTAFDDSRVATTPAGGNISGSDPTASAVTLTGLSPGTTYYYRIRSVGATGTVTYGHTESFTTNEVKATPTVTTLSATRVDDTTFILRGSIDANLTESIPVFEYKMDDSTLTGPTSVSLVDDTISGASPVEVQYQVSGLTKGKTYYYRIYADPTPRATSTNISGATVSFATGRLIVAPTVDDTSRTISGAIATSITPRVTKDDSATINSAAACIISGDACDDTFTTGAGQWVVASNGSVTFTPAAGYTGTTTAQYQATDSFLNTGTGTLTATVVAPPAPTVLDDTVTTLGATPVTADDSATATAGASVVRGAACWVDGASCVTTLTQSGIGAWTVNAVTGAWTFSAVAGYSGTASAVYRAEDNYGTRATATKRVVVEAGPDAYTDPADDTTTTSIRLRGRVNPRGNSSNVVFVWSTNPTLSDDTHSVAGRTGVNGNSDIDDSVTISGLIPYTMYYYEVQATNNRGTARGSTASVRTAATTPLAATDDSTGVSSSGATLNGTVRARGPAAGFRFDLSREDSDFTDADDSVYPGGVTATGNTDITDSVTVTGLTPYTVYYYRVRGVTASYGDDTGSTKSFRTAPGTPLATTEDTGTVTSVSAVLRGTVRAQGPSADIVFDLSSDDTTFTGTGDDTTITRPAQATGNTDTTDSVTVTGLTPYTVYYYRVRAHGNGQWANGNPKSFRTGPGSPVATTLDDTVAIDDSTVIIRGRINPRGAASSVIFEYSADDSTSWDDSVTLPPTAADGSDDTRALTVSDLEPVTTYWYRIRGTNAQGSGAGSVKSFTTPPGPPRASTLDDSIIDDSTVMVRGRFNARGASTNMAFEYTSDDSTAANWDDSLTAGTLTGTSDDTPSTTLTGLVPRTTYWYRARGTNLKGTVRGQIDNFTTPPGRPRVATLSPTNVSSTGATMRSTVNARNGPGGQARMRWTSSIGVLAGFGNTTRADTTLRISPRSSPDDTTAPVSGAVDQSWSNTVTGLTPGTTYYYQATISTVDGDDTGSVQSFTTLGVTTASLPDGTAGSSYSTPLSATGGTTPYTWSLAAGSLPVGLSLTSGTISGTPATSGSSPLTVRVTDGNGYTHDRSLTLTVHAPVSTPTITTMTLPDATAGIGYSQALAATGGYTPYTWTLAAGTLPAGLGLAASGTISGTPSAPGSSTFTVQVDDSLGSDDTQVLTLTVKTLPPPPEPTERPPGPPRDLTGTAGDGEAVFQWLPPLDPGTSAVTAYQVRSTTGTEECITSTPTLYCRISGLTNGTDHEFVARARNSSGWSAWSSPPARVRPEGCTTLTILVSGSRKGDFVTVDGTTKCMPPGTEIAPIVSVDGNWPYRGINIQRVRDDGTFRWQRRMQSGRNVTVYFTDGVHESNRLDLNVTPTILISGTRQGQQITITGQTSHIPVGVRVIPMVRVGNGPFTRVTKTKRVRTDGTFIWRRIIPEGKRVTVYFIAPKSSYLAQELWSNSVTLPPR